jgi:hypothetical protein
MPFIRGRYYVNPIAGGALEAAREAEEALAASHGSDDNEGDGQDDSGNDAAAGKPARRIDIEIAELVPAQSGRATKGYIARVHRDAVAETSGSNGAAQPEKRVFYDQGQLVNFLRSELAKNGSRR